MRDPDPPVSSSTESKALRIGDPHSFLSSRTWLGIQSCLDSRFHGNDTPLVILNRKQSASDWGSSPSRHPALDAGSSPAWIPVFTGMTEEGREWLKGDTGMTSGMRMTIDKLRTMLNNPTGQAPRYSLFCYLKWLHPCGKPQGMRHLKISGNFA